MCHISVYAGNPEELSKPQGRVGGLGLFRSYHALTFLEAIHRAYMPLAEHTGLSKPFSSHFCSGSLSLIL